MDASGLVAGDECGLDSFHRGYAKIHGWASLFVCIFGSIANSLNIVVLTRREMSSPTNAILTGLAVADLLVMLEYIPYASHMYLYIRPRRDMYTYGSAMFVLFHSIFAQACHTISIWLTVTLAVWRYIAIAHPQRNREWCNFRRTVIAITGAYVICPLICMPIYFTTALVSQNEIFDENGDSVNATYYNSTNYLNESATTNYTNSTLWFVSVSETIKTNKFLNKLNIWMYSVVIKLIPCLALTILSLRLILALMEAKKRRKMLTSATLVRADEKSMNNHSIDDCGLAKKCAKKKAGRLVDQERQTDRTTRMLLAVLLLFLLTEFPQGVLGLLSVILGEGFFRTCYAKLGIVAFRFPRRRLLATLADSDIARTIQKTVEKQKKTMQIPMSVCAIRSTRKMVSLFRIASNSPKRLSVFSLFSPVSESAEVT